MKSDKLALYKALIENVTSTAPVLETVGGECWAMAEAAEGMGLGMMTPSDSIPAMFPEGLRGLPLKEAAKAVSSWNLTEASFSLAACNAFYNTPARMEAVDCRMGDVYPTVGLDLRDKTVGIIGHMNGPRGLRDIARAVYVIERDPRPGDYPDAACDWLLPQCDVVLITGSSLINKTLPHLLELCENAVTVLTGPSVPMCPVLLDFGIDRLAGFVVTAREAMTAQVKYNIHGSPYACGESFLLMKK
jgi:uncharacterized protein (DUF4213/DUF364 family)